MVINRTPLVAPVPIASIETTLGLHILGTIPPAPDACVRAQNQRAPLVALDPESLVASL